MRISLHHRKVAPADSLGERRHPGPESPGWGEPGDFPYQGREAGKSLSFMVGV